MTNKYEEFIKKLIRKTLDKELNWENASFSEYSHYIVGADDVLKAFKCSINELDVFIIEERSQKYINEFDQYFETRFPFLCLVKNNISAKILTEENVKKELLFDLLEVVSEVITKIDDDINSFLNE